MAHQESIVADDSPSIVDIPSCERNCFHGLKIWHESGGIGADLCSCATDFEDEIQEKLASRANSIKKSQIPPRYANRLYGNKTFIEIVPAIIYKWLTDICKSKPVNDSSMFLGGRVGNGKTHIASDCAKQYIMETGKPARYYLTSELVDTKKNADFYGDRHHREDKYIADHNEYSVQCAGLLIIDEIIEGLDKRSKSYLEKLLDQRYCSGLPTILISNHTFDRKTSLGGVTIEKILGYRLADRLKDSIFVEFTDESKRGLTKPSRQEIDDYRMPKSVLALETKRESHLLNWITRNPVFESVRENTRTLLRNDDGSLKLHYGFPVDAPREKAVSYTDVWLKGDSIVVSGPPLSVSDAETYLACLAMLTAQHRSGKSGLVLRATPQEILTEMKRSTNSRENWEAVHRSLSRISSATINYADNLGRQWIGPLFHIKFIADDGYSYYLIYFNNSMITFYRTYEYTKIQHQLFKLGLGSDGVRMQMFLRSHKSDTFNFMDVDEWLGFLGKPVDRMDSTPAGKRVRKYHRHKFSKTIRKQVEAGVLTPDSTLPRKRGHKVSLTIVSEIPPPLAQLPNIK